MAFFSWSRWFRSLLRPQVKPIQRHKARLNLETLEARLAPAQFVWTGTAGDGKWATAKNWSNNVAPSPSDGLDDLIFQSSAGTKLLTNNIGSASGALKINSMSFSVDGYQILTGSQPIVLGSTAISSTQFGQTGTITVNNGLTETINMPMTLGGSGSGQQTFNIGTGATLSIGGQLSGTAGAGWTKTGTGTMVLSGDNGQFTGAFTDKSGVTQLQSGSALGKGRATTNTVTVQQGGQIQLYSGSNGGFTVPNKLLLNGVGLANTGPNSGALLNVAGYNTWSGNIELDSDSTIGAASQTFNIDTSAGPLNITQVGTTVTVTTATPHNFAIGQTVVFQNIVTVPPALGTFNNPWNLQTFTITKITGNTFSFTVPTPLPPPLFFINFPPAVSVASVLTLSGIVSDFGAGHNLTKEGSGTAVLASANTYRGATTINNGVLSIQNSQSLGTGPGSKADNSAADAITVNANFSSNEIGTLQLAYPKSGLAGVTVANKLLILNGPGYNPGTPSLGVLALGALDNLLGHNTWTGSVILGSAAPNGSDVTIRADGADPVTSLTVSGVVSDPNTNGGFFHNLTKTGPRDLVFTSSNTYGGATTIANGTLIIEDSQALGPKAKTSLTTVANGAALELAVDSNPDSLTGTRGSLTVYAPLQLSGNGAGTIGTVGALFSQSGTNTYFGNITLVGGASIGVGPDPNEANTVNYFANDYSLTVTSPNGAGAGATGGLIGNTPLTKLGVGHLILPTANDLFRGAVNVSAGWVTIENNDSLGTKIQSVAQNRQPLVTVNTNAALMLDAPAGTTLDLHQNFSLAGTGIDHAFSEINRQGALENLSGINTIEGNVGFAGKAGVGVETVFGPASQLALLGEQSSSNQGPGIAVSGNASGTSTESDQVVDTGSTSGTITIRYNMFTIPDSIDVYYGVKGAGGIDIKSTGLISGTGTLVVPYAPSSKLSTTTIEIVLDQGGGLPGTVWNYSALIVPTGVVSSSGVVKLGSGLLDMQGDGTYSANTDVRQGVLLVQNSTALGTGNLATPTTVTVEPGAALALANSTAYGNGGLEGGIQIAGQRLVVNGDPTVQTVTLTGALTSGTPGVPSGTFALSFNGSTTPALSTTIAAAGGKNPTDSLTNALNALPSIGGVKGSVTVTQTGDQYTIHFGGTLANTVLPPLTASAVSTGTKVVIGTGLGNTSLGAPLAPFSILGSASSAWSPSVTLFQASAFMTGLTTVPLAPYGSVGSGTIIPTDDQWLGPVTLNAPAPIDVPASSRLILSGNIDDAGSTTGAGLTKIGAGELVLSGTNTFRGSTYVGTTDKAGQLGFDPNRVNEFFGGNPLPGGLLTVESSQALGAAATPTVQTVTLTGGQPNPNIAGQPQTTFTLQFAGAATDPLPYTGVPATDAATVLNALNALTSVGATAGIDPAGVVTVNAPSPGIFVITFGGSFVGFNQPQILPLINSGAGSIVAATTSVGSGGVIVQNGTSLQLQGSITVAGKTLALSGTGYNNGTVPLATPNWAPLGPGVINNGPTLNGTDATAGRVTGIASDPTDPNTIYVATAGGGAWKTQNGLSSSPTWVPIFDNSAAAFSGAIAVAPTNTQMIYLGTGEASGSTDSYAGSGVYASPDAGHTWALVTNFNGTNPLAGLAVSKIVVDPTNPSLIYVATSDQVTNAIRTGNSGVPGIYRFDGTTWTNLTAFTSNARQTVVGTTAATKVAPPGDPGPDDNYLYGFPQKNVTWSDVGIVGAGANATLFAALGSPGGTPYVANAKYNQPGPVNANAVYFSINPAAATPAPWYLGDGIIDGETKAVDVPQFAGAGSIKLSAAAIDNPFVGLPFLLGLQPNVFQWQEIAVYAAYESVNAATIGNLLGVAEGTVTTKPAGVFFPPVPGTPPPNGNLAFSWVNGKPAATTDTQDNFDLAVFTPGTFTPRFGNYSPTASTVFVGSQSTLQESTGGIGGVFAPITIDSNQKSTHADFHALTGDGANAVLAGTDGGIWSLNTTVAAGVPANTWTDLNSNLADAQITSVSSNTTSPTTIFAGTQSAGIIQYQGTPAWNVATLGVNDPTINVTQFPYGANVVVNPNNPKNAFAFVTSTELANPEAAWLFNPNPPPVTTGSVVPYSLLMQTTDGGKTWQPVTSATSFFDFPPATLVNTPFLTQAFSAHPTIAFDQANANRLVIPASNSNLNSFFVNNVTLLESLDGGATFRSLGVPTTVFSSITHVALATFQGGYLADSSFPNVVDQGAANDVPGTFYVVDDSSGTPQVWITRDYGQDWINRSAGLPAGLSNISDIEVDPSNSNVVYVLNGGAPGTNLGRVFQSIDGGLTWNPIGGATTADGLPDVPAWKLVVDPRSGSLFVGTDQGAYSLTLGTSSTWVPVGTGLPQAQVKDLYLNTQTNTLIAGTYGRGVWSIPLNDAQPSAGALTAINGSAQWAGPVVLTGATTISALGSQALTNDLSAAQLNIQGTISDAAGTPNAVTIGTPAGVGAVTFSGANTYTGTTEVADGVLRANNQTALGSIAAGTTVDAGAALQLESSVDAEPLALHGNGIAPGLNGHNTGALESIANNNTFAGPITLASADVTLGVASGSTLTITGAIAGSGNLIKELTGTLALDEPISAPNVYTGATLVYQGALEIESSVALPNNSNTTVLDGAQVQLFSPAAGPGVTVTGATLDLSGSGIGNTGALLNLGGSNAWNGPVKLDASPGFSALTYAVGTVNIGVGRDANAADPTDILTIGGNITEAQAGLFAGITKLGPDTLVLAGNDSYNGGTFISTGVVTVQNANALGDASNAAIQRLTVYDLGIGGSFTVSLTLNGLTQTSPQIPSGLDGSTMANQVTNALTQMLAALNVKNVTVTAQSATLPITGSPSAHQVALSIIFQGSGLAGLNLPQLAALATGSTAVVSKVADYQAGTEVAAGAALKLDLAASPTGTTVNESVLLNGTGPTGNGALENVSGFNTVTGQVTLATGSTINTDAANGTPTALALTGDVTGPWSASLTKIGPGALTLTHANDYQGTTLIDAGYLSIQNSAGLGGPITDDTQTITLTGASSGTYNLTFTDANGVAHTTDPISANWTAAQVQAALQVNSANLPIAGAGNVAVTFDPVGGVYTVTFIGALAGKHQAPLTLANVSAGTQIDLAKLVDGGQGNTIVAPGATLQLTGGIAVSTEQLILNGTGVGKLAGALESVVGTNSWDPNTKVVGVDPVAPDSSIILAGNASIAVDNDAANGTPGLTIDQAITESAAARGSQLTKVGTATLQLSGSTSNAYTGLTTVADGTLLLNKQVQAITSASESTTGVVTITTTASLGLAVGQLVLISGVATAGYNGLFAVATVSGTTFTYANPNTGLATDTSGGEAAFVAIPNGLTVGDGVGNLTSAVARVEAPGQLGAVAALSLNADGLFDPNGQAQTVGALTMIGGTIDLSKPASSFTLGGNVTATSDAAGDPATILTGVNQNGTFSLGGASRTFTVTAGAAAPLAVDLDVQVPVTATLGVQLIKAGNGRLALDSNNNVATLSTGIRVTGGDLQVNGTVGEVSLNTAVATVPASVSGTGSIGTIDGGSPGTAVAGTINPGDNGTTGPTAILTSNPGVNAEFWNAQTSFWVDLQSAKDINGNDNAGAGYDQLIVNGNLALGGEAQSGHGTGGAVLTGTASNVVQLGDTFTILKAGSGSNISGRFASPAGVEPAGSPNAGMPIAYIGGSKFDVNYVADPADATKSTAIQLIRAKQTATITLVASNNSPVYGQDVSYTATVTVDNGVGSPPPGTDVQFVLDAATSAVTVKVPVAANGKAVFDPASAAVLGVPLGVGTHTIDATYEGQTTVINAISAPRINQTVGQAPTTTVLSFDQANLKYVYGQNLLITAIVAPKLQPTLVGQLIPSGPETVQVTVDGNPADVQMDSSGRAQLSFASHPSVGLHTVSVAYGSDSNYLSSAASTTTFTVVKDTSSLSLGSSSGATSLFGQPVTFTATINVATPGTATPTGSVSFYDGSTLLGTGPINKDSTTQNYVAIVTTANLAVGLHSINAVYSGSALIAGSVGSLSNGGALNVTKNGTVTTLGVTPITWGFNQQVLFTAQVNVIAPGTGVPPGNVLFFDSISGTQVQIGQSPVNANGQAIFATTGLAVGPHNIYAVYAGSASFATSTSNSIVQTVLFSTTAIVTSVTNPITSGAQATFNITVSGGPGTPPSAGIPTGTVTLTDNTTGNVIASNVALTNGRATIPTTTALTAGVHQIQATFTPVSGSAFNTAVSNVFTETVRSATTTTLTTDGSPTVVGQPVNITVTVIPQTPVAGAFATGQVTFLDNGAFLGQAPLTNGAGVTTATLSAKSLTRGTHNLTASYAGDANYTPSTTAGPVQQTVLYASTTSLSVSQSPLVYGNNLRLLATVAAAPRTPANSGFPTGVVNFYDGITLLGQAPINTNLQATLNLSSLAVGSHSLTAVYQSNGNYGNSTSAIANENVQSPTSVSVSSSLPNGAVYSQQVVFTAVVTTLAPGAAVPTGTVSFTDLTTNLILGTANLDNTGTATLATTSTLSVTTHSIRATYRPAIGANAVTSFGSVSQPVSAAATTTTVTSSSSLSGTTYNSVYGEPVTLTALVAISAGGPVVSAPLGQVWFVVDGAATPLAKVNLSGGKATFIAGSGTLPAGQHSINAIYKPNTGSFTTSNATLTQAVAPDTTTVAVSSSANPGSVGGSVTITAKIVPDAPGSGIAAGTVQFIDPSTGVPYSQTVNGSAVLTFPVDKTGKATITLSNLQFNDYNIQATYTPPAVSNFQGSTSDVFVQSVRYGTTTKATATPTSTAIGNTVTITATVGPSTAPPTSGLVDFFDTVNGQQSEIGQAAVDPGGSGVAQLSTNGLVPGNHVITTFYEGDGSVYAPSTANVNVVIYDVPSSLSAAITSPMGSNGNPPALTTNTYFTITATLVGTQGGNVTTLPPGATATLTANKPLGGPLSASFSNGKFTFSPLRAMASGAYSVTVSYGGFAMTLNFTVGAGRVG